MRARTPIAIWTLAQLTGVLWCGFFVFMAIAFLVLRGFADEPGYRMTVLRALLPCGVLLLVGSPGCLLARVARATLRRLRSPAAAPRGFDVIPPP